MLKRAQKTGIFHEDRGESLIEFAFTASVLLAGLFGIMDFSRALYTYHFVSYAAQEGTRYASVRGADWSSSCSSYGSYDCIASSADITSYVQGLAMPGIESTSITVTPSWPQENADETSTGCNTTETENSKGCLVKVVVSYPFHFFLPYLPKSSLTMQATSEGVIAY